MPSLLLLFSVSYVLLFFPILGSRKTPFLISWLPFFRLRQGHNRFPVHAFHISFNDSPFCSLHIFPVIEDSHYLLFDCLSLFVLNSLPCVIVFSPIIYPSIVHMSFKPVLFFLSFTLLSTSFFFIWELFVANIFYIRVSCYIIFCFNFYCL